MLTIRYDTEMHKVVVITTIQRGFDSWAHAGMGKTRHLPSPG